MWTWLLQRGGGSGGSGVLTEPDLTDVTIPAVIMRGALDPGGGRGRPANEGSYNVVNRRVLNMGQGDLLPLMTAQLYDEADGNVVDLTDTTVYFSMRAAETGAVKINRGHATIVQATTGNVEYEWAVGDTDTAGTYLAEWEVIRGGKPLTFPNKAQKLLVVIGAQIA